MTNTQPTPAILAGTPLVSLVVPCHREGRFLDDCLWSLRRQSYQGLEIIVIEDGGNDDSAAIAASHALKDDRISVIATRTNRGLGAARNLGLGHIAGDLVGFVDGDDYLPVDSIEKRVEGFARQLAALPEQDRSLVAGVYGDWNHAVEPAYAEWRPPRRRTLAPVDFAIAAGQNPFIVSAPLVRPQMLRESGGFCETVDAGEDYLGWLRLLSTGAWFVAIDDVIAIYRQKRASMLRGASMTIAHVAAATQSWSAALLASGDAPLPVTDLPALREYNTGEATGDNGTLRVVAVRPSVSNPAVEAPDFSKAVLASAVPPLRSVSERLAGSEAFTKATAFLRSANDPSPEPAIRTVRTTAGETAAGGGRRSPASGGGPDLLLSPTNWIEGLEAGVIAATLANQGHRVEISATGRGLEGAVQWLVGFAQTDASVRVTSSPSNAPRAHLRFADWTASEPVAAVGPFGVPRTLLKTVGFAGLDWTEPHAAKRWRTSKLAVQSPVEAALLADRKPAVTGSPLLEALASTAEQRGHDKTGTLVSIDASMGSLVLPWLELIIESLDTAEVPFTLVTTDSRTAHRLPGKRLKTVSPLDIFSADVVITCAAADAFLAAGAGAQLHYFNHLTDPGHRSVLASLGASVHSSRETLAAALASPSDTTASVAEQTWPHTDAITNIQAMIESLLANNPE